MTTIAALPKRRRIVRPLAADAGSPSSTEAHAKSDSRSKAFREDSRTTRAGATAFHSSKYPMIRGPGGA